MTLDFGNHYTDFVEEKGPKVPDPIIKELQISNKESWSL